MGNFLLAGRHVRPLAFPAITLQWYRLLALLVILLSSSAAGAQTITIPAANSNTGSVRFPLASWFGYERTALLYTSGEISASGTITSVGFYLNSVSSPGASPTRILMKTTSANTLTASTVATEETGATLVYNATIPAASFVAGQWITLTLSTPFAYTGANNLEIIVETNATNGGSGEGSTGKQFRYSTATGRSQTWAADNTAPAGSGSISANRPNVQLAGLAPLACAPPSGLAVGSITSNSASVSFTAGNGNTSYVVTYTPTGGATATVAPNPTASPVSLTGLTPGTTYTVTVTGNCAGSTTSTAATTTFTTIPVPPDYVISRSTGVSYSSIQATGTSFTGWSSTTSTDDNVSGSTPIGFNFQYFGQALTSFRVSTNGWVTLSTTQIPSSTDNYSNNLSNASANTILAPFWEDLVLQGNAGTAAALAAAKIKYQLDGTAPNRVLTVEWAEMETFNNPGPNLNFQVQLYEASNEIRYVYGNMSGFDGSADYTYSYSVGLSGALASTGQYLAQQAPNTTYFLNSNAGTANSGANALNLVPSCNSSLRFVPGTFVAGTAPTAVVPANDEPANATALALGATAPTDFCAVYTSANATATTGITACTAATPGTPDDDVWFNFVLPSTSNITITLRSSGGYNGVLQLFSGAPGSLTAVACANATGLGLTENYNNATLAAGTYYVRVYHSATGSGTNGTFVLAAYATPAPPINDECAGAITITSTPTTCSPLSGTTLGATATAGVTACSASTPGTPDDDVWYKFVSSSTVGTLTLQGASGFDGVLQLYSGTCGTLTALGCINSTSTGGAEVGSLTGLTPTQTYFVRVYHAGAGSGSGNFTICLVQPTCSDPTALAATNVTTTTADLTFTPGFGATDFTITYTPQGGTATTVTPAPTASPVSLTGLTPGTLYTVTLQQNCVGGQQSAVLTTTFTTAAPPPANDLCSGAIAITCGQTVSGTTVGATAAGDPTAACSSATPSASPSVFYSFAGTGDIVTVTTCGTTTIDTELFVYSGTCGALTCVGGNDDFTACAANGQASSVTFTSVVGTTYYFMVQRFSFTTATGAFSLNVSCVAPPTCAAPTNVAAGTITTTSASVSFTPSASATSYTVTATPAAGPAITATGAASPIVLSGLTASTSYSLTVTSNCGGGLTATSTPAVTFQTLTPAPANDECSTAIAITAGTPGAACSTTSGTTTGATASAGVTNSCSTFSTPDDDVWYSFVAAGTTQTITVVGATGFDAVVNLRAGSCPGTDVQCVDNTGGGGTETITATGLTMGATYFVRVYHYNTGSGTGNFTICVTTPALCAAPTAVAVGTITSTTASVSFTAGNGNTGYTVTYTPSGGSALTATGAASPIALSGLTPGTQYSVTVTGNCSGGQTATSTPAVTFTTASPPPANDLCSGATPIACGQTLNGTTVDATTTGDPTAACGSTTPSASPSVFYSFVGTGDIVTVTTCGTTSIDTELFVYSGTCGALTCVGGNDDFSACAANGQASSVTFTSVVGTTYYFMVQRFSFTTATGAFSLNVSCTPVPADLTVASGQSLTASGTYNNITVQTGGTLTLTGNTTANGNTLVQTGGILITNCQVLDGTGTFTLSAGAELRICAAQGIRATASTGAIQSSGMRTFSTDATYVYNGTVAQVSGNGLPLQVRTLAVDNPAGLTLSRNLSVAQVTRLTNGNLTTDGNTFTLLSSTAGTALIDNTGGSVVGTGTMQRAVTNAVTGPAYRHFSSPVQSTTLADLTTTGFAPTFNTAYNNSAAPSLVTPFPTVFGYDQSRLATVTSTYGAFDKGWFSPAGSGDVMQPNRGYTANAPATTTPIDFVGTFNNATQNSGTLSRGTDAAAGWQLLGNPYPAPLDWSTVGAGQRPGMDGAMYVYQSTGQYAGTYRSYDNGVGASPLIDAGSGYFARVTTPGTSGAVNLTNANRVTVFGAQPAFGRGTTDTRPQLHLQLAGAGLADDTYLYLEQGATAGVDSQYDATKLANPAGLDLASLSGTIQLAINGLAPLTATDVVVPLVLRVPQAGSFSLEVGDLANFGAATVYLRDALTGTQLQLATGTRYQFALATASAGTGRFSVVFRAATVTATKAELNAASVSLYPNPSHGSFTVLLPPLAGQREVRATLVNALGQAVLTRTIGLTAAGATAEFNTRFLATGVYTLKLQAENQALTKRVVVE